MRGDGVRAHHSQPGVGIRASHHAHVWHDERIGSAPAYVDAIAYGVGSGLDLLQNQSAAVDISLPSKVGAGSELEVDVRVTNLTGHKLPTGYGEGRRMWWQSIWSRLSGLRREHSWKEYRGEQDAVVAVLRTYAQHFPELPGPVVSLSVSLRAQGESAEAWEVVGVVEDVRFDPDNDILETSTVLQELPVEKAYRYGPNPVSSEFFLQFPNAGPFEKVRITSMSAQEMMMMYDIENPVTLDLSSLADGSYLLEFTNNRGIFQEQIVKVGSD